MVMLTPISQFTADQVFMAPWMDDTRVIADLVIIVNTYPVEGLYMNDKSLDVSTTFTTTFPIPGFVYEAVVVYIIYGNSKRVLKSYIIIYVGCYFY